MADLNEQEIKKIKQGEFIGLLALIGCGIASVCFIVLFSVAQVRSDYGLRLVALIVPPVLLAVFAGVAAYCNVKFGGKADKLIKGYVQEVFLENAALMHPERDSLTFYVTIDGAAARIKVNNYKEIITFDFSAFGKPSLTRKAQFAEAIQIKLCTTFCKLYDRGAKYADVAYSAKSAPGKKQGKAVFIIQNGKPDKKAYKTYIKNR